ncbi:hypothetical protein LIER_16453 [Lithospermum erythrorhizon]|uniref:Uncharacterized protein n=1 Tax=Lithospermum erythrorhizon TaxID=34254 RepID=A0AAV3Q727_LITER
MIALEAQFEESGGSVTSRSLSKGKGILPSCNCVKSAIHEILHDGIWLKDQYEIANSSVNYFKDLFCKDVTLVNPSSLLDVIPTLVSPEDNEDLIRLPGADEIKRIVFDTNPNSAAGSNGFNGKFFHASWDIIKDDLIEAVQDFFCGGNYQRVLHPLFLLSYLKEWPEELERLPAN